MLTLKNKLYETEDNCTEDRKMWCIDDEDDVNATYVNLLSNQESYTAFEGVNVWKAIYSENCLLERIDFKKSNE